ncbi:MAG: hypothetical protein R2712_09640 [Vicinamibacterales bacterium]
MRDAQWRGWQQAHQRALEDLQAAAQEYHRLVVDQAFAAPGEEGRRLRQDALGRLEERRRRLDEIREQQPTWPS